MDWHRIVDREVVGSLHHWRRNTARYHFIVHLVSDLIDHLQARLVALHHLLTRRHSVPAFEHLVDVDRLLQRVLEVELWYLDALDQASL